MRLSGLIPLLFTLAAFILTMLCIFGGSSTNYLEGVDMLTVNTSLLGQNTLNTSKPTSKFLQSIEKDIQSSLNDVASALAKSLHIHDFYSGHLLDYCEGYYTPGPIANLTADPSKNVTFCSNHTSFFHFDPAAVIQNELKPGLNLSDLKWPSAIQDGIRAVELATKVMFVLYCVGAAAAGGALVGALLGVWASGRLSAVVNLMVALVAFFALLIASAISTAVINKVCDVINEFGKDINVEASKGNTFEGMTWAATILVLLAGVAYTVEFVRGRRENVSYVMEKEVPY